MASGWKKNNPGCPCCDLCDIDEFSSAVTVEDANTRTVRNPSHPQSPYASWLQLEMLVKPSGIGVILLAWDDSTPGDGLYLEFTPDTPDANSGYISVYTKDDTRIAGPLYVRGGVSDEWHTFTICYDPDAIPDQLVITFEPAGSEPTQQFSVVVPDTMTAGRKAGYGTGNASGDVSVRNYNYDRLWYCGNGTENCQEFASEWDYYNDLPVRTPCHACDPCPDALQYGSLDNWIQVSGTWTTYFANGIKTSDADAEAISLGGTSWFKSSQVSVAIPGADTAIIGITDAIGYNKLYLLLSFTGGPPTSDPFYIPPIASVYWRYDEDAAKFYFWIYASTVASPPESLVWQVFRVADGGAASSVDGPNTLTLDTYVLPYRFAYADGAASVHAPMRKTLLGTVVKTEILETIFSSPAYSYAECDCGMPHPKEYLASVAGVVADQLICTDSGTDYYYDTSLLNLGPVTLKNYDHYDITQGCFNQEITPTRGSCAFSYDVADGNKFSQVYIWAFQDGEYTEVRAYAYATYRPKTTAGPCQEFAQVEVEFRLRVFGRLDMRTVTNLEIPYYGSSQLERVGIEPECTRPATWIDASNAKMTITAVT